MIKWDKMNRDALPQLGLYKGYIDGRHAYTIFKGRGVKGGSTYSIFRGVGRQSYCVQSGIDRLTEAKRLAEKDATATAKKKL